MGSEGNYTRYPVQRGRFTKYPSGYMDVLGMVHGGKANTPPEDGNAVGRIRRAAGWQYVMGYGSAEMPNTQKYEMINSMAEMIYPTVKATYNVEWVAQASYNKFSMGQHPVGIKRHRPRSTTLRRRSPSAVSGENRRNRLSCTDLFALFPMYRIYNFLSCTDQTRGATKPIHRYRSILDAAALCFEIEELNGCNIQCKAWIEYLASLFPK